MPYFDHRVTAVNPSIPPHAAGPGRVQQLMIQGINYGWSRKDDEFVDRPKSSLWRADFLRGLWSQWAAIRGCGSVDGIHACIHPQSLPFVADELQHLRTCCS